LPDRQASGRNKKTKTEERVRKDVIAPEPSAVSLTQYERRGRKYSFVAIRDTTRKGEVK